MNSQNERPNFRESRIPTRLAPAADVTKREYRAARIHQGLMLLMTGIGIYVGWLMFHQKWLVISIPILGPFTTPAIFGVVFHVAARYCFSRASELKTARLRMYPEYKRFKVASEAFASETKENSHSSE